MQFLTFKKAVEENLAIMAKSQLYVMDVSKDDLWDTYINSFPEGTNPIYKTRGEYDCNCCKNFIKNVGNLVIFNTTGELVSIWDVQVDSFFQGIANALSTKVKSAQIRNVFLSTEPQYGLDKNFQMVEGQTLTWNHFHFKVPSAYINKASKDTVLGETRSTYDVFKRSLTELTMDAVDTVLELIAQNSLYRGQEHVATVTAFRNIKVKFDKLTTDIERDRFCWLQIKSAHTAALRIRNSAIGTLLVTLSAGEDMEDAVKAFERMVAPTNYKRPTALVTKSMIENAKKTIEELGLTSALERRYATIDDITINNILFANRDAKSVITGDVFADMAATLPEKVKNYDKVEEVTIDAFIANILPKATSIEVMIENHHKNNLVSLIAPVDSNAASMFKWANRFSWTYAGEVADSIKERVKKAGGTVEGDLCCRLAWDYEDDLDFHMFEPGNSHIYYGNRRQRSPCGGMLDVDANGADGICSDPVENIFYADKKTMKEGIYELRVNNYFRRSDGRGFEVEIEFEGSKINIASDMVLRSRGTVSVAKIQYSKKNGFSIVGSMPSTQTQVTNWGVTTQSFQKVSVVMLSPNHWDGSQVGNKHWFFMIDGCKNEGQARGFYNEFLSAELDKHRKVLEMVGSKMKTEHSEHQLSGLGFSSTQRNSILCKVTGTFNRVVRINF